MMCVRGDEVERKRWIFRGLVDDCLSMSIQYRHKRRRQFERQEYEFHVVKVGCGGRGSQQSTCMRGMELVDSLLTQSHFPLHTRIWMRLRREKIYIIFFTDYGFASVFAGCYIVSGIHTIVVRTEERKKIRQGRKNDFPSTNLLT